jgi:hypothetical protein
LTKNRIKNRRFLTKTVKNPDFIFDPKKHPKKGGSAQISRQNRAVFEGGQKTAPPQKGAKIALFGLGGQK